MIFAEKESIPQCATAPGGTKVAPRPVWYVTNGAVVVGPVGTDLLLRGITSSRIPNDCMVAQRNWGAWRPIAQIRDVARIVRTVSWASADAALLGAPGRARRRGHGAGVRRRQIARHDRARARGTSFSIRGRVHSEKDCRRRLREVARRRPSYLSWSPKSIGRRKAHPASPSCAISSAFPP